MLFRLHPRGERDLLLVPVLPGSTLRSVERAEPDSPRSDRSVLVAVCVAGAPAVLIAAAVLLFARGSGSGSKTIDHVAAPKPQPEGRVVSPPAPTVHASGAVQHPPLQPPAAFGQATKQDTARAHALRLAARLPVKLETTALLRVGSTVYAVGGTTRSGTPSDGIWELDLRTGRVTSAGHFIEPLTDAAAAVRGGVLYLVGGWTGEKLATGVLRWTPGQSSSLVTRLPIAARGATAAFVGGKLYVAAGSPQQVFEIDVDAGTLSVRTTEPPQLRAAGSNLDYLTKSSR